MPREYAHYDYGELVESIQFYLQIDRLSFANRHGIGCQARHLKSLNGLGHVPTTQYVSCNSGKLLHVGTI